MRLAVAIGAGLTALSGAPAAEAAAPPVSQLVVYRDGSALQRSVSTRATRARVNGRPCTTGAGTALSALVRSRPGRIRLRDFGSCSTRAADGGGLFVEAIRGEANRGQDGWVYKVGGRAASAGAADPGGPFGRGRLRARQRVTWFYCRMRRGGCQRTLDLTISVEPGALTATVHGYDDEGEGVAVEGASVRAGRAAARTDAAGQARVALATGRYRVWAEREEMVRSFGERVAVP